MEIIKKRINNLTKILIVLFVLAFVFFLHKRNSREKLEEFNLVNSLATFIDSPIDLIKFQIELAIAKTSPELYYRYRLADSTLMHGLYNAGVPFDQTIAKSQTDNLYMTFAKIEEDSITKLEVDFSNARSPERMEKKDSINQMSIRHAAFLYWNYFKPFEVHLVTNVDTTALAKSLVSILELYVFSAKDFLTRYDKEFPIRMNLDRWKNLDNGKELYRQVLISDVRRISDFLASKNPEKITITDLKRSTLFSSTNLLLNEPKVEPNDFTLSFKSDIYLGYLEKLPAKTQAVSTTMHKVVTITDYNLLPKIDSLRLARLVNYYDQLSIEKTRAVLEDEYLQAYKSISVFGFEISTSDFPYVIQLLTTFVLISLYFSIKQGAKRHYSLFAKDTDDDILEYYINKRWLRLICWIGVTAVLSYLIFPDRFFIGTFYYFLFFVGFGFNLTLGIICYYLSTKMA